MRYSAPLVRRPSSSAPRVTGSRSSGPGSRPSALIRRSIAIAVPQPTTFISGTSISSVPSAGLASATAWPSDSHSRAASPAAAATSGWIAAPSSVARMNAIRSRPGGRIASSRKDAGAGGAK